MRDRTDAETPAELERLRGRLDGGAFPHPPVLPVVAAVCLLFGLSFGLALAPKDPASFEPATPAPTIPMSPATTEPVCMLGEVCSTPWPAVTIPVVPVGTAPSGGVSLAAAIESARRVYSFDDQDILSVTLTADGRTYWADSEFYVGPQGPGQWVWQIVLRGRSRWTCTREMLSPQPLESPATTAYTFCQMGISPLLEMREIIIVDYLTGQPLVTIVTPYPISNP